MPVLSNHAFNTFAKECYKIAKEKGWHEEERNPLEAMALIVSECGEAIECIRDNMMDLEADLFGKPVGLPSELADIIIRVADFAIEQGIDLGHALDLKMQYNRTRDYRHGGKKY